MVDGKSAVIGCHMQERERERERDRLRFQAVGCRFWCC